MHACPLSMKNKEVLGGYLIVLITKSSSFENPSPWFPAFVILTLLKCLRTYVCMCGYQEWYPDGIEGPGVGSRCDTRPPWKWMLLIRATLENEGWRIECWWLHQFVAPVVIRERDKRNGATVKGLDDHYQLTQQTNSLPSPPGLKLLMGKKKNKQTWMHHKVKKKARN